MKKIWIVLTAIAVLCTASLTQAVTDSEYFTKVFMSPDTLVVKSGGDIAVRSGGIFNVESGGYLKIAGTQITATAAQFNFLSGVTAGTVTASKCVVVGTASQVNALRIDALTSGASGAAGSFIIYPATATNGYLQITATNNGAARNMTITNAALGQTTALTIPDPGASTGQFALAAGNNKVIFTTAGATALTLPTSGTLTTLATVVAATNEWAAGQTFITTPVSVGKDASANTLRVYPATTAKGYFEIVAANAGGAFNTILTNAAVGQTTTVTIPDPGSAAGQLAIANGANAVVFTTAGATALTLPTTGTVAVLGGTQEWSGTNTWLGSQAFGKSGTAGSATFYPATAANGTFILSATNNASNKYLALTNAAVAQDTTVTIPDPGAATANAVLDAGNATIGGSKTFSSPLKTSAGVGAIVAGKCSAVEYGDGILHQTVLTLTLTGANDLDLADGDHGTGVIVYDLPEGRILILGVTMDASVTTNNVFNATPNDVFSLAVGTVVGADDNDLTGTEVDLIPKFTNDTASNTVFTFAQDAALAVSAQFDGTTTATNVCVNVAIADACNTDATTYAVTGTVTLTWINLGDY